MMEKKNNNPEREAKDREFFEMMQVKTWQFYNNSFQGSFLGHWHAVSKEDAQHQVQEEGAERGPEGEQEEGGDAQGGEQYNFSILSISICPGVEFKFTFSQYV
jgi:hypothetical protein